ncbi:MAG TPA: hypothetical protein VJ249_03790 [Candidatus Bathyarchaeia archaeon]|nr:hypothetical protein [Candidatus Bathyarchaeia archaeon]
MNERTRRMLETEKPRTYGKCPICSTDLPSGDVFRTAVLQGTLIISNGRIFHAACLEHEMGPDRMRELRRRLSLPEQDVGK